MNTIPDQAVSAVSSILEQLQSLALPLAIFAGALAICTAWVLVKDRSVFDQRASQWRRGLLTASGWLAVVLTVWAGVGLLTGERPRAESNFSAAGTSEFADAGNAVYESYSQEAPYVATFHDQVYTKTITLPSQMDKKALEAGADSIAMSYFGQGGDYKKVENSIVHKGDTLVLVHTVTMEVEDRIAFNNADVTLDLKHVNSRKGDAFDLGYHAVYEFKNPSDQEGKMRFRISLPETEGTIEGLALSVNGTEIKKTDSYGTYEWLGTLGPGATGKADLSYRLKGAGRIDMAVAEALRPVEKYSLKVTAPFDLKFGKHSIQPTGHEGHTYSWTMDNVISHNGISIVVPAQLQMRHAALKLFSAAPLLFILFGLCFLIPMFRPDPLRAWAALAGIGLAVSAPMALAAVAAPVMFVFLASVLCVVLGIAFGGPKVAVPSVYVACLVWTVLISGYTIVSALLVSAVFLFVAMRRDTGLGSSETRLPA